MLFYNKETDEDNRTHKPNLIVYYRKNKKSKGKTGKGETVGEEETAVMTSAMTSSAANSETVTDGAGDSSLEGEVAENLS